MIGYAPLCEKQSRYIKRSLSCWLNVAEGGKRAGKNVMNIMAWAASLENHPNKLHLAAGVSISAVKLNILDSDGLGLTHIFKGRCREGQYKDRDALFIKTRTGEKIVLIAGGDDKMTDLTDFMHLVKKRCRALVLIGNAAARFKEAALAAGIAPEAILEAGYSMEKAVELARAAAQSGDVALLSPACASFDMYSGMAERGRHFKDIVRRMARK